MNPVNPGGGDEPPGYWKQDDWHGCVWTGVDDKMAGTAIEPQEFLTGPNNEGSYCVSGQVGPTQLWEGVSLLGFNLAEEAAGADCSYDPEAATTQGPPGVLMTGTGIAINFANVEETTLRIQLQGPDGATDAAQRWCQTITLPQGPAFLPYAASGDSLGFHNQCWVTDEMYDTTKPANAFDPATDLVSAIVFAVPGDGWGEDGDPSEAEDTPFEYCINGFAAGDSAADAPVGGVVAEQTGVVGVNNDADRASVVVDGEKYVIQNNNWGATASDLVIEYTNNSFVVTTATGTGASAPASFPSIYVGANGFTEQGKYATTDTDNLPIQISSISSIPTTFRWSGDNGSYNSAYDVWFANADPAGKRYNDGLNGFIMVWLAKPSGGQVPIGSDAGDEDLAGHSWDVWVGNRGSGPSATEGAEIQSDPNAKVVSFVIKGANINSLEFDLKEFIDVAVSKYSFSGSMFLTDVFAGFEIWNGGTGLKVDEFKIDVQPN